MFAASKTDQNVAGGPPPSGDPYWTSVSLLTNFENNLTFQDGSTNNFAITRTGVVNPSLNTPFSGGVGGSEYFNGSTGYLTGTSSSSFAFGTGDFTVEAWVNPNDTAYNTIFSTTSVWFGLYTGKAALFAPLTLSTASVPTGSWTHVAFVRSSGVVTLYVNGTASGTASVTTNFSATSCLVGQGTTFGAPLFNGFMSNLRVVNGTAVYTSAFTPSTAPLTAITNTSLLITGTGQGMFDNSTFVDQGPNALTMSATGAPVYSGLSPFGNTYPGSVLFSGSSQALTTPSSSAFAYGTGDFTWEMWIYPTSATWTSGSGNFYMLDHGINGGALIYVANRLAYYNPTTFTSSALYTSGGTIAANAWTHIAASRASGTTRLYINGTLTTSGADSHNFGASVVSLAQYGGALAYYQGHISNARIVKGTAVYTANFTPSTTPLTAITNTSLLVRGDTGAFYDVSNNGNGMTSTGTTEVTTQIKQFGNESAVYTSTGRQSVTNATNLQFGSGDYTIEAWVYRPSATLLRTLLSKGGAATGWLLQINSSQQVIFTVTSSIILTSTTTITAGTWTHVAVTRSGTSTRLFVGGNLEATATDSTAFSQTENLSIGVDRSNTSGLNGYLDDIRLTKGVARYTATFTPPTATFPTGP